MAHDDAPREAVIVQLVQDALKGMETNPATLDATAFEVFSALLTLALRAVQYARFLDYEMTGIRDAIARLYAECGEMPTQEVH